MIRCAMLPKDVFNMPRLFYGFLVESFRASMSLMIWVVTPLDAVNCVKNQQVWHEADHSSMSRTYFEFGSEILEDLRGSQWQCTDDGGRGRIQQVEVHSPAMLKNKRIRLHRTLYS